MPKVSLPIFRNRHGTYYYRLGIPLSLQPYIQKTEIRFSLGTQERSHATISALLVMTEKPQLFAELRQMADDNKKLPPDFFDKVKYHALDRRFELLQRENADLQEQMEQMVPRARAKQVGKIMHERGMLRGKQEMEDKLMFPPPAENTPLYSEVRDAYLTSLQVNRTEGGTKEPPSPKTMDEYRSALDLFITVMGDQRIGEIDEETVGKYFGILKKLPANMQRLPVYRGKTPAQILKMNPPPQSLRTVSKKMERVSTMFGWAIDPKRKRRWGIDANPFSGYGQSKRKRQKTTRRLLTDDDLKQLFNHPDFVNRRFQSSYAYWLIPLGVFTGARIGELCQLALKDFVESYGIPCIDVTDEGEGQKLKTANAKRRIPIHSELIRLGLLRHVERMRQAGEARLFPELSITRRDGPGQAASNWFQRFREKAGVVGDGTVYHSLRHRFITALLDEGISPHAVAPIVGHEVGMVAGDVYWNKENAIARQATVEAFTLPEDVLSMIPVVETITFTQARGRRVRGTS